MTGTAGRSVLDGHGEGEVLALDEPLSFWGGVDPASGRIIDAHHPQHGEIVSGKILVMPTSRGSCSGSGVFLDLALAGRAPSALVFGGPEDVLTLGALVAAGMFKASVPVIRLDAQAYGAISAAKNARITPNAVAFDGASHQLRPASDETLTLTARDRSMLAGSEGEAARIAMGIVCAMAESQGATSLLDVTRAHIDGCIYASPANLVFAERMAGLGAKVSVPTTMNAISIEHGRWQAQGITPSFGAPAQRLADCYLDMGCRPSFTCSPYLLDGPPSLNEPIAWSESNAVIYANSVLGARTQKHPDFLDLCIAVTGRAPLSGVYLDDHRRARTVIDVEIPDGADDLVWPLIGYCAGLKSPDRIPLLRGLKSAEPGPDALKALCAAFGTTSAAPMLHIADVTPEAEDCASADMDHRHIGRADFTGTFEKLNQGAQAIDLVAIGSPHASADECRRLAEGLEGRRIAHGVALIITLGRAVKAQLEREGTLSRLVQSGVTIHSDLCWCSIVRPLFPVDAKTVVTNSGKYAHYGPGLSGCAVRLASLAGCIEAATTGRLSSLPPDWLS
ncbi:aconitase family protein [Fulvimarina sp. MAC3]|uniref:cis-3-hydroxy-L-proline dehydratase n=1 Tax=Fulvimarina sp. MAC3 TaxID=3148887 RepID=UPI0031FD82D6